MKCPKSGTEFEYGRFCPECGEKMIAGDGVIAPTKTDNPVADTFDSASDSVAKSGTPASKSIEIDSTKAQLSNHLYTDNLTLAASESEEKLPVTPTIKKNKAKIIIPVIAAVVLIAAAVAVFLLDPFGFAKKKIVGEWELEGDPSIVYSFNEDGSGKYEDTNLPFVWNIEKKKLTIEFSGEDCLISMYGEEDFRKYFRNTEENSDYGKCVSFFDIKKDGNRFLFTCTDSQPDSAYKENVLLDFQELSENNDKTDDEDELDKLLLESLIVLYKEALKELFLGNYEKNDVIVLVEKGTYQKETTEKAHKSNEGKNVDFRDEFTFEKALNNGEDVTGKTVTFIVKAVKPDSILGFNLWSGEHLNFVSDSDPGTEKGQVVTAKITSAEKWGKYSWELHYDIIEVDGKKPAVTTTVVTTTAVPEEVEKAHKANEGKSVYYRDEVAFENALNSGDDVTGKTVTFIVNSVHPDSILGFNLWSGEHLNFVSDSDPEIKAGQAVTAKITKAKKWDSESWELHYNIIEVDGKKPVVTTTVTTTKKETTTVPVTTTVPETTTAATTTQSNKTYNAAELMAGTWYNPKTTEIYYLKGDGTGIIEFPVSGSNNRYRVNAKWSVSDNTVKIWYREKEAIEAAYGYEFAREYVKTYGDKMDTDYYQLATDDKTFALVNLNDRQNGTLYKQK